MSPTIKIETKSLVQVVIILAAFTILFSNTIAKLVHDWSTNDNYSHGFLVPFIAAYMIWQKKDQLSQVQTGHCRVGFLTVFLGMCIFVVGNVGAELFIMRTAIVITIVGICLSYLGYRNTAVIAVPLLYLLFMIPLPAIIWNKIAFPLQLLAASLTENVVQMLGIPLLREGNVLHLPNTTLEVVDACSGLRSLTSLFALSAAASYMARLNLFSKWILFLSAVPIAIIVNIVRLTSTAYLALAIGPEAANGFLHDISGFLSFAGAMVLLFGLYTLLRFLENKFKQ